MTPPEKVESEKVQPWASSPWLSMLPAGLAACSGVMHCDWVWVWFAIWAFICSAIAGGIPGTSTSVIRLVVSHMPGWIWSEPPPEQAASSASEGAQRTSRFINFPLLLMAG